MATNQTISAEELAAMTTKFNALRGDVAAMTKESGETRARLRAELKEKIDSLPQRERLAFIFSFNGKLKVYIEEILK